MITIHWLIHTSDFLRDFDPVKSKVDGNDLFMQLLERMIDSEDESKWFVVPMKQLVFKKDSSMDVLKSLSSESSILRFIFDSPYGNVILLTETYGDIDSLIKNVDKLAHFHCLEVWSFEDQNDEPVKKLIAEGVSFKKLSQILSQNNEITLQNC